VKTVTKHGWVIDEEAGGEIVTWAVGADGSVGLAVCSSSDTPDRRVGLDVAEKRRVLASYGTRGEHISILIPKVRDSTRGVAVARGLTRALTVVAFLMRAAAQVRRRGEATEEERWAGWWSDRAAMARAMRERERLDKQRVREEAQAYAIREREEGERRIRTEQQRLGKQLAIKLALGGYGPGDVLQVQGNAVTGEALKPRPGSPADMRDKLSRLAWFKRLREADQWAVIYAAVLYMRELANAGKPCSLDAAAQLMVTRLLRDDAVQTDELKGAMEKLAEIVRRHSDAPLEAAGQAIDAVAGQADEQDRR
jgi:hypothetical protein